MRIGVVSYVDGSDGLVRPGRPGEVIAMVDRVGVDHVGAAGVRLDSDRVLAVADEVAAAADLMTADVRRLYHSDIASRDCDHLDDQLATYVQAYRAGMHDVCGVLEDIADSAYAWTETLREMVNRVVAADAETADRLRRVVR